MSEQYHRYTNEIAYILNKLCNCQIEKINITYFINTGNYDGLIPGIENYSIKELYDMIDNLDYRIEKHSEKVLVLEEKREEILYNIIS